MTPPTILPTAANRAAIVGAWERVKAAREEGDDLGAELAGVELDGALDELTRELVAVELRRRGKQTQTKGQK